MKIYSAILSSVLFLSGCVTASFDTPESRIVSCKKNITEEITRLWAWKISNLSKDDGILINSLFTMASNNASITYTDQKRIHKKFGVWVRKGPAINAIYSIYPSVIKKSSDDFIDLAGLEAANSLIDKCEQINVYEGLEDNHHDFFVINDESYDQISSSLDDSLKWYVFNEDVIASDVIKIINNEINNIITSTKAHQISIDHKATVLSLVVHGFYDHYVMNAIVGGRYSDAVELAFSSASLYSKLILDKDSFNKSYGLASKAKKMLNNFREEVMCTVDNDDRLLAAAILDHLIRVDVEYCSSNNIGVGICSSTLISKNAQVSKDTRSFNKNKTYLKLDPSYLVRVLSQFQDKDDLSRSELAQLLLGKQYDQLKKNNCI